MTKRHIKPAMWTHALCPRQGAPAWRLRRAIQWLVPCLAAVAALSAAEPAPPLASSYHTLGFGIDSGLPSNVAQAIVQTKDGYLWVGTEGGLARFDGVRLQTFRVPTTPELGNNLIRCLAEDPSGNLWIGTQVGLCEYSNRRFLRIGGISSAVADLACDNEGSVWIATLGQGLMEMSGGRLLSHSGEPGLPPNPQVLRLFHDSADQIIIAFRNGGLAVHSRGAFYAEPWADASLGEIGRIGEAPAGTYWLAVPRGVVRWRLGKLEPLGPAQGLPIGQTASAFFSDAEKHFWVVSRTLYRADTATADHFTSIPVPAVDELRTIMQDREGSYWLGTSGTGILRMRPSAFRVLFPENGTIQSVTQGEGGSLWAAPVGGRLVEILPDAMRAPVPLTPEESTGVQSVLFADHRLWIGTRRSLCCWAEGRLERFPLTGVRVMYQDRQGAVWFGSANQGVIRYRSGVFEPMGPKLGSVLPPAEAFGEDQAGNLYIGLDRFFFAFHDGKATPLVPIPSIPDILVRSIFADPDGNLWVGTKRNGLLLRQGSRWYHADSLGETLGELVSAIQEDRFGRLWLGTARGVVWGSRDAFVNAEHGMAVRGQFHVVGKNEGVAPSTVGFGSQPVSFNAADGSMWFASHLGIITVRPDRIASNPVVPPVLIESVTIDGRMAPPLSDPIRLRAGTHSVSIDYTALSFVRPDAVLFRYRLEGLDPGWVEAGGRRTAFYTDIPPGRHRFEVIACNNDGVWNETGASVTLVQRPWFYQTWWFYALAALAAGGLVVGLHERRTAVLRRENERLEQGIAERTRELVVSEQALRVSEDKFSKAFHTQPDGIAISRLRDGAYLEFNASFTRITGYAAAELIAGSPGGGAPAIWTDPADRDRLIAAVRAQGNVSGFECPFRRKNGQVLQGSSSACIIRLGGEECLLHLLQDVTVHKQLEDQLQHTQKMEAIGQLAGGIAHDYNNILTSTLLQLGFLQSNPALPPELRQVVRELTKDANRSAALTRQLLTFSRRQVMVIKDVELNGMLRNLFGMLRRLLGETVHLEFIAAPGPVGIAADTGMIEQVVTNLCVNARDAMGPKGGVLEVETSQERITAGDRLRHPDARSGDFACLRITDQGSGMAPETVQRLFEPFFTTKAFGKGTGLGLAIIYGIIKQHQGWIEVESALGRGTTFRVFLPARPIPSAPGANATPAAPRGGSETILLVEDEAGVRDMVSQALTHFGYRVLEAADGEAAIRIWEERTAKIDLLLSDMVMPRGISGLELAERFRGQQADLRVIVTSGYSVDLRQGKALEGARMTYLSKPYDVSTLAATVRRCLDEA